MKQYFCVGTYTEPVLFGTGEVFRGKGKGISICSLENGEIELVSEISVRNPSYLCMDEHRKKLYAVNEMKEYLGEWGGGITQLSYDASWRMKEEYTCNIRGTDPCHILLAPGGELLFVSNFASGSVTVVPLGQDGAADGERAAVFQHQGSSVHPLRQKDPHAHAAIAVPGKPLLYVPDLGTDKVYAYRYEGNAAEPDLDELISVPAGSGPRTGVFTKDGMHFYLLCEISSEVIHYQYEEGRMVKQNTVSTLPEGCTQDNIGSDLHLTPDGAYLYASNRGHDSLVCYRVGEGGRLELVECISCRGKTPRNFAIDPTGSYLLCGNQDSDTISIFAVGMDGKLTFQGEQLFETPVCIRFFHT